MKIKHLHTLGAVISAGMTSSFHCGDDYVGKRSTIVYVPEMRAYLIDGKTLIPESYVKEVVLDTEETKIVSKPPKEKK